MKSGDEHDVRWRGHTGFDAYMTSQKGDFRTNEALAFELWLLCNDFILSHDYSTLSLSSVPL